MPVRASEDDDSKLLIPYWSTSKLRLVNGHSKPDQGQPCCSCRGLNTGSYCVPDRLTMAIWICSDLLFQLRIQDGLCSSFCFSSTGCLSPWISSTEVGTWKLRTFSGIACLSKVKILRKGMIKNAVQAVTASSLVNHWHYTYEARNNRGLSLALYLTWKQGAIKDSQDRKHYLWFLVEIKHRTSASAVKSQHCSRTGVMNISV